MAARNCILCSEGVTITYKFVNLGLTSSKCVHSIINSSRIREDNIHELFEPLPDHYVSVSPCIFMSAIFVILM